MSAATAPSNTASSLVKDLVEAGIHFGQRAANWNPRMQPYIYGKRSSIHIIDIKETIKGILLARKFIAKIVADGQDVCFVGTKRQAHDVLAQRVAGVGMPFVTERWLGGTLTNFRTIRARLKRLEELEAIERNDNFQSYSKKMESQLKREMNKIKRNLEGIRNMSRLPGCLMCIDTKKERNALLEARKLGIPTICLIDTDGDPDLADIAIPGNDDSMRSIDVVIRELCAAVSEGKQQRSAKSGDRENMTGGPEGDAGQGGGGPRGGGGDGGRRRSGRTQFKAEGAPEPTSGEVGAASGA
ncbi:MAG TPA: 30S ribosomal protein S2 [Phycisphaerales bacterium]|nr:30S ribosomal protein S2 [Phycisphaerales bacterium]